MYGETEERCIQGLVGRPEKSDILEDLDVDEKIILKWIFTTCDGEVWNGLMWLRTGTGGEHL